MTHIQQLQQLNDSTRIFADTITRLSSSQGFYQRSVDNINEMDEDSFAALCDDLTAQHFVDSIDVIFYLEV